MKFKHQIKNPCIKVSSLNNEVSGSTLARYSLQLLAMLLLTSFPLIKYLKLSVYLEITVVNISKFFLLPSKD